MDVESEVCKTIFCKYLPCKCFMKNMKLRLFPIFSFPVLILCSEVSMKPAWFSCQDACSIFREGIVFVDSLLLLMGTCRLLLFIRAVTISR